MALRDQIKAASQAAKPTLLAVPTPELPEYEGQIFARRISPRRLSWVWQADDQTEERGRMCVAVASDSEGSPIFQNEDVAFLVGSDYLQAFIERVYAAGLEVNGLTRENRESWRKNSKSTASAGSDTSS